MGSATHASEINADASLLAIGGDSAGGLLATATTLMARDRNGPGIALQILINPSTSGYADFDTRSWQDYDGMVLNQAEVKRDLDLTYGDQDRSHPWISPLKASDVAHLPSALILTAGCDPLRDEWEAYADRLKQAGVRVTLTRYSGMIHGFFGFAGILDEGKTAIDQVAQALQQLAARMRLQDARESIELLRDEFIRVGEDSWANHTRLRGDEHAKEGAGTRSEQRRCTRAAALVARLFGVVA